MEIGILFFVNFAFQILVNEPTDGGLHTRDVGSTETQVNLEIEVSCVKGHTLN